MLSFERGLLLFEALGRRLADKLGLLKVEGETIALGLFVLLVIFTLGIFEREGCCCCCCCSDVEEEEDMKETLFLLIGEVVCMLMKSLL